MLQLLNRSHVAVLAVLLAWLPQLESKGVEHESQSLPLQTDWDGSSSKRNFQTASHYDALAEADDAFDDRRDTNLDTRNPVDLQQEHELLADGDEAIHVVRFQLSTQRVDLQEDAHVMFTLGFECQAGIYDPTGSMLVYPSQAVLLLPSGQSQSVMFMPSQHLVDGDVYDGIMESELLLSPWNTEEGTYQIAYIMLVNSKGQTFYLDQHQLQAAQFPSEFAVHNAKQDHQVPRLCNIAWAEPTWPYTGTPDVAATWEPPKVLLHLFVDGLSVHSICMPMAPTLLYLEQGSGLANRSDDYLLASYLVLQSLEAPSPQLVTTYFSQHNQSFTTASCSLYQLKIAMPIWTWAGQWTIKELYLADEAGNAVMWSREQLNRLQLNHPVYIGNKNLTFHGEDLYDYQDGKYLEWLERVENGQEDPEDYE